MAKTSRRDLLKGAVGAGIMGGPAKVLLSASKALSPFVSILRPPDLVRAFGSDDTELKVRLSPAEAWQGEGFDLTATPGEGTVGISLRSNGNVARIQLRWHGDLKPIKLYLGDQWERSYADLHWAGEDANRVMPWYFMAHDGARTHGFGVKTNPGALCFWTADSDGISLWADVRCGGNPVKLGDRELQVAEVVCRQGKEGENAFEATHAFCQQMCPQPRLPKQPVYGTNDWNYAYGNSSADLIGGIAGLVSELSPNQNNRPFSVIDEGWQMGPYVNHFGYGPWVGNPRFGDMQAFGARLKSFGVRPGLWYRPLTPLPGTSESWRSPREHEFLDPTIPEVLNQIEEHVKKFVGWGYELVKHDYTTFDILGQWGIHMGASPTKSGWSFNDPTKTTAEVISNLYQTIREAAGDAYLIGCNTMTHLAAGTHELQRTGDDTSGRIWDRCRRMGVNTLGFRGAQQGAFYEVDPDIVAITKEIPWRLAEQWLRLVSQSGTALFTAIGPGLLDNSKRATLKQALESASSFQHTAEPLDWMETNCPRRWKLQGKEVNFDWMSEDGGWPFGD